MFSVPTLADYVTLTPRMVTPVYPADASLIVSLLDIHAPSPDTAGEDDLEILEAGTGHGSLTLHLAQQIHPINASRNTRQPLDQDSLRATHPSHKAVIHSVDLSAQYSEHAKKIVHGFRQGLYSEDVSFHVANVSDWLDQQVRDRKLEECDNKSFLRHILLDMPGSYRHIEKAVTALRPDGSIMLFNPSITQITAAADLIKTKKLPLFLERVLELGSHMTGGKEWDVRAVKPRALIHAEQEEKLARKQTDREQDDTSTPDISANSVSTDGEQNRATMNEAQGFEMICRPKVYARVVGGGFLGVWRKKMLGRKF
ncbi:MAG: hypothetical protein Q9195_001047 [Heterodermia aff. obscurata]